MNNKNLVMLSETELENISGGVNKKALGDAVEYGTAAVSTAALSVVGQLLGFGIGNKFIFGQDFFNAFDNPRPYIPGAGIVCGSVHFIGGIACSDNIDILSGAEVFTLTAGGGVGGWFAGRAIGKAIRKKLGL